MSENAGAGASNGREKKFAVVAVHKVDRRELHRLGNETERKILKQREMDELNKVDLSMVREDIDCMLATILDLATCLSAAESEAAREFANERKGGAY